VVSTSNSTCGRTTRSWRRSCAPTRSARPSEGGKSCFSIASICTTSRRIPACASTNQGGLIPQDNAFLASFVCANYLSEMCSGSEAGSCLRLIDFCITQDNAFLASFVRAYEKCAALIPASNTEATARMQVSTTSQKFAAVPRRARI